MKIAMAGDHAGFNLKKEIKELLESQGYSDCRKAYQKRCLIKDLFNKKRKLGCEKIFV